MALRINTCCHEGNRASLSTGTAAGGGVVIGVALVIIGILATQGTTLPPKSLFGLFSAKDYFLAGALTGGLSLTLLFIQVVTGGCKPKKASSKPEGDRKKSSNEAPEQTDPLLKQLIKEQKEQKKELKKQLEEQKRASQAQIEHLEQKLGSEQKADGTTSVSFKNTLKGAEARKFES